MRIPELALLLLISACYGVPASTSVGPEQAQHARGVEELFAQMQSGTWNGRNWPQVGWLDVPALLDLTDSDVPLQSFPVNGLSSQSQAECSTGIMAAWLIEGIRRDAPMGYPSLNPLCFDGRAEGDWCASSERNRARVALAYRAWWRDVHDLSEEQGKAVDPLAGTGLAWY